VTSPLIVLSDRHEAVDVTCRVSRDRVIAGQRHGRLVDEGKLSSRLIDELEDPDGRSDGIGSEVLISEGHHSAGVLSSDDGF
jgi:hypothetical protein